MHVNKNYYYAFAVSLIVLLLGFFLLIYPKLQLIKKTKKNYSEMQLQIKNIKNGSHEEIEFSGADEINAWNKLINLIENHGLNFESIRYAKTTQYNNLENKIAHLVISGDVNNIENFTANVLQSNNPFNLLNFSYENKHEKKIILVMDIVFYPKKKNVIKITDFQLRMCASQFTAVDFTSIFSIRQFNFIGFIAGNTKKFALLRLPNASIHEVKLNDVIGKEKAKIILLESNKIIMQFKSGEQWILYKKN